MKPLGYWLIHIHELLETGFERLFEDEGLTRRHWQVLNTIASKAEIHTALRPFGDDFRQQVDELAARGWVNGEFELTTAGREAHQRVSERVHAIRAKVTEGISADEYATLMNLLQRVATNAAALV
ncbi:hypothetical protein DMH04_20655 [Kibdelosporangium aridum]|uniref:MarR family transcriptional regulator n=1 Tax=Kibdelosporangium aridum TaxID=2030 RepID=A0A428Z913_KIBAR|nr:hypothetical protein [Kibdelosporangium aridum]RSM84536.1 hypothetical protein DMH04_20655 [Kibdelosporangium aridum]